MSGPDDGFFASSPPLPPGYGPSGQWTPSPVAPRTAAAALSPSVVGAATSLALAGVAALWTGLSMLTLVSEFGGGDGTTEATFDGWLLVFNGVIDIPLAYFLLRRVHAARWLATAICAWWVGYWLYQLSRVSHAASTLREVMGAHFGGLTLMAVLGLLLLAGWAVLTGAMLWLSGSGRHFSGTG